MKKVLLILSILFVFAGTAYADGNRAGVQFESGGNLGLIYYGDNYGWAAGGSVGFKQEDAEIKSEGLEWDTESTEFSIFARKNFNIADKTYLGLGVVGSWASWEESVFVYVDGSPGDVIGFATDAESFSIAPYFILDYHIGKDFILNAGAHIVTFEKIDHEWGGDDEALERSSTSYFDPFFGITYLF